MQNWFLYFCVHGLTQSGEYNLGLITKHIINRKGRWRILCQFCLWLSLFVFSHLGKYDPFHISYRSLRQNLRIWCQWWNPSGSPIGPWLTRHPVFLESSSCDAPPPLIFCIPGVWGVSTYTVRGELLSGDVDDIFTYLVVACYDDTSVAASDRVAHRKGLQATFAFSLKVRGVNVITCT